MRDDDETESVPEHGVGGPPRWSTTEERWAAVELTIQMAIDRGEFDNLPGAGKPIEGLGTTNDPDWWIRRKIQTEDLTGLAPPAFQLRKESAEVEETLDAMWHESDVREYLEEFNKRVRHARMQLLGGPPVVTPLRDIDDDVRAWRERKRASTAAASAPSAPAPKRRLWWRRSRPSERSGTGD